MRVEVQRWLKRGLRQLQESIQSGLNDREIERYLSGCIGHSHAAGTRASGVPWGADLDRDVGNDLPGRKIDSEDADRVGALRWIFPDHIANTRHLIAGGIALAVATAIEGVAHRLSGRIGRPAGGNAGPRCAGAHALTVGAAHQVASAGHSFRAAGTGDARLTGRSGAGSLRTEHRDVATLRQTRRWAQIGRGRRHR